MHRYDELEKLYYRKKILKFFFIFLSLVLVVLGMFFIKTYFFNNKKFLSKKNEKIEIKKENNTTRKTIKRVKKIEKKIKKENVPILTFELPNISKQEEIKNQTKLKNKQIQTNKKHILINNKQKINTPIIKEVNINLSQLIENFNLNPNYDNAIIISNYFFNKNDFKHAKLWALKANSINPQRYESWKIFAMILIKKHQKQKAKEVLQTYLNDYGYNDVIEKLLRSLNE